jgi:hypothetical protein
VKNSSRKRRKKKEILKNPVRNGFLDPKNNCLKTGICNLALGDNWARFAAFSTKHNPESELLSDILP